MAGNNKSPSEKSDQSTPTDVPLLRTINCMIWAGCMAWAFLGFTLAVWIWTRMIL